LSTRAVGAPGCAHGTDSAAVDASTAAHKDRGAALSAIAAPAAVAA
jgi:hypothetical protein